MKREKRRKSKVMRNSINNESKKKNELRGYSVSQKIDNFIIENTREEELNMLLDNFLRDSMANNLLNEFEAGDIRFLIIDYLSEHSIEEIPEYIKPEEKETIDEF